MAAPVCRPHLATAMKWSRVSPLLRSSRAACACGQGKGGGGSGSRVSEWTLAAAVVRGHLSRSTARCDEGGRPAQQEQLPTPPGLAQALGSGSSRRAPHLQRRPVVRRRQHLRAQQRELAVGHLRWAQVQAERDAGRCE